MATVRRTISLQPNLAAKLEREAKQRGISFSAVIAELVQRAPAELPYEGLIEDDPDLSLRVEEVLGRLSA